MPQVMAAVLVGAGIAAGIKWLMKEVARVVDDTRLAPEEMRQGEPVGLAPKDLGALEYDATTGVYRPVRKRAN